MEEEGWAGGVQRRRRSDAQAADAKVFLEPVGLKEVGEFEGSDVAAGGADFALEIADEVLDVCQAVAGAEQFIPLTLSVVAQGQVLAGEPAVQGVGAADPLALRPQGRVHGRRGSVARPMSRRSANTSRDDGPPPGIPAGRPAAPPQTAQPEVVCLPKTSVARGDQSHLSPVPTNTRPRPIPKASASSPAKSCEALHRPHRRPQAKKHQPMVGSRTLHQVRPPHPPKPLTRRRSPPPVAQTCATVVSIALPPATGAAAVSAHPLSAAGGCGPAPPYPGLVTGGVFPACRSGCQAPSKRSALACRPNQRPSASPPRQRASGGIT